MQSSLKLEEALEPLVPELRVVVSYHVGARNQTWTVTKSSQ